MNKVIRTAMIFAAGLGTRMKPLTDKIPKPLIPVNKKPLLSYAIETAVNAGVEKIIVNTHYKYEMVEEYLKTINTTNIVISREDKLMETGGGILKVIDKFNNQPFFIMNSDVITINKVVNPLIQLSQNWNDKEMDALLLLHNRKTAIGYDGKGDFDFEERTNQLIRKQKDNHDFVFTGVQIMHPRIFTNCPDNDPFSLNIFYKRAITPSGYLNRIHGVVNSGDWLHIGTPEGISLAENYFSK